jgi:outer membrane phospholipase A
LPNRLPGQAIPQGGIIMTLTHWVALGCAAFMAGASAPAMAEDALLKPKARVEPGEIAGERFQGAFYAHEPIYGVLGGGDEFDAKFQFSFKLRIWDHTFFGYTQTSVWDLYEESSPFRDSSYRPSLFYYNPYQFYESRTTGSLGFSAGLEHESNGKAEADSRSINTAFVRPLWLIGDREDYHWRIAPKLYAYLEKSDNNDIQKYRGYGDFYFALRHPDKIEVALTARQGTTSDHRSLLAEFSVPFSAWANIPVLKWFENLPGLFYVQAFKGYGETLIDYNIKGDTQFRVGISATRDNWAEPNPK